jgi:hypothetical protein
LEAAGVQIVKPDSLDLDAFDLACVAASKWLGKGLGRR